MFFANATYTSKTYGTQSIAICSDKETERVWSQKPRKDLRRTYYERPIAEEIMKAAAKDSLPADFDCHGIKYTLIKYTCRPEERFYNKYRKNYVVGRERIARARDIYVYSERCRCTSCYAQWGWEGIENICGMMQTRDAPHRTVEVDVQHCTRCGKYFIDAASLALYEQKYGLLYITKHHITGNEEDDFSRDSFTYKENTVLSRNGYSTKLLATERRRILVKLISSGISSKAEIKDILTRFIRQRGERFPPARAAWSSDLEYVNQYNMDSQEVVRFLT